MYTWCAWVVPDLESYKISVHVCPNMPKLELGFGRCLSEVELGVASSVATQTASRRSSSCWLNTKRCRKSSFRTHASFSTVKEEAFHAQWEAFLILVGSSIGLAVCYEVKPPPILPI